jgi:4-amino-4-deoxy-L-arabinose transferase-like glycosyltransferase
MTTTGALAAFFVAENRARTQRNPACGLLASLSGVFRRGNQIILLLAFYFFSGLSLLAKGLIGFVIIFGVIVLYYIIRRERPLRAFSLSLLWGIPLSLIVAGFWYGPMIEGYGRTFIDQFIIQHHFARFATNKYHHPGPIYFYLPVLIGLALPWSIVLIAALASSRRWNWRGDTSVDRVRTFALVWLVFPILFFSFSGSKLTAYILPVLPAAALLIGERIVCFVKDNRGEKVLRLTGIALVALACAGIWYSHHEFSVQVRWLILAALPLALVGVTALLRPQMRKPLFLMLALATILSSVFALKWIAPVAAKTESVRELLNAAASRNYATTPVVQMHTIQRAAEFYAANRLTYGSDGEPVKFEGAGQVMEAAHRNGVVLCFVPIEFQAQLTTDTQLQTEMIGNNGHVALFAVRLR